jgi:hypothetical protein
LRTLPYTASLVLSTSTTEPGALTSSVGNERSFWSTLDSFRTMLHDSGFSVVFTADPWYLPDRTFFVALPGRSPER